MKFFTYILESEKLDKFYIGYTNDVDKRLAKHNTGASQWTRVGIPWKIIYTKVFDSKTEAIKYEKYLKGLKNKEFIRRIISEQGNR